MRYIYSLILRSLIIVIIGTGLISAQDKNEAESPVPKSIYSPYVLEIERLDLSESKFEDTIDVIIETDGSLFAGFDIKVATKNSMLEFVTILPGDFLDSCEWEFFNARQSERQSLEDPTITVWQIVGLAEMVGDEVKPLCYNLEGRHSLIKIVVSNKHLKNVRGESIPIYFLWQDCTDNTLSGIGGSSLVISSKVIDFIPNNQIIVGSPFPSLNGTPKTCIKASAVNKPRQAIEFRNGGITFDLSTKSDTVEVK